jgi:hypothetical protein
MDGGLGLLGALTLGVLTLGMLTLGVGAEKDFLKSNA